MDVGGWRLTDEHLLAFIRSICRRSYCGRVVTAGGWMFSAGQSVLVLIFAPPGTPFIVHSSGNGGNADFIPFDLHL